MTKGMKTDYGAPKIPMPNFNVSIFGKYDSAANHPPDSRIYGSQRADQYLYICLYQLDNP
jgi:hypothetical protein